MKKILTRALLLLVILALILVMVPSAAPLAQGEEALPTYQPVLLEAADMAPLALDEYPMPLAEGWLPDNGGYVDPTISVRIETTRAYKTHVVLCWIQIADASQMREQVAGKTLVSDTAANADKIASRVNAVVAVNTDYYMHRTGHGYVVRNGELVGTNKKKFDEPRADIDVLIIDDEGDFHIVRSNENAILDKDVTRIREEIAQYEGHIMQALNFGPGLVINGEMNTNFQFRECAPDKRAQRLAIAQVDKLSYLIVVTHGPDNSGSTGLTMKEFAQLLSDLGVQNAYNLDGGSSSTLVLNNKKINSRISPRPVGDILYFSTGIR